jgi:hypothetical protein
MLDPETILGDSFVFKDGFELLDSGAGLGLRVLMTLTSSGLQCAGTIVGVSVNTGSIMLNDLCVTIIHI